jgi:2-polyprenyl-3-methyl-5-hydroxy-6-metoxy-1,4-benzoquinol methylase
MLVQRAYRWRVDRRFRKLRRDQRDQCWCGGSLRAFRWHASYGVCDACGCYVNRHPPCPEEFATIYSSAWYWGAVSRMRGLPDIRERAALYTADGRLNHWLRLVEKFAPTARRVVEIGCAPGVLLAELQRRGCRCVGVEAEESVAGWIRERVGVDVRCGIFPDAALSLGPCDLFMAFDVLEHVPSPEVFLREAARLLTPGGVAIIQTPIDRYDDELPLGEEVSVVFDDVEHLFIFVDKAMMALGARTGLEVVSLTEAPWQRRHELCIYRKPYDAV